MKQKLLGLLLSVTALALTGCGGFTVIDVEDDPPQKVVDLPTAEPGDSLTPAEEPSDDSGNEDTAGTAEEDTGTDDGGGDLYWDLDAETVEEDGTYNSVETVSLYLHLYEHLPDNYITKSEARDLGWTGGSVERYAPGCAIGGDRFGNREGLLPDEAGRTYYECDIDTIGESSRGAKRIIFSNDGLIYYTEDHYESFTLLYGEE